jgi:hypothetical protein
VISFVDSVPGEEEAEGRADLGGVVRFWWGENALLGETFLMNAPILDFYALGRASRFGSLSGGGRAGGLPLAA